MHAILASIGTGGDVFPYAGLGVQLQARGHRVTLAASERFRNLASCHGLEFLPLVSVAEDDALFTDPEFWQSWKSPILAARWGVQLLERQYAVLASIAKADDTVFISNPGLFPASLVAERFQRPLVSLLLQPGLIPSVSAPPILPGVPWLGALPRPLLRLFWHGLDGFGYVLIGRHLNKLRSSLGLLPLRRIFRNWLAPKLTLGVFPEWFAQPQPDWPPQIRLTGFSMFDGGTEAEVPASVLEFCRAGTPPVAFTFGTGLMPVAEWFRAAVAVCQRLNLRALLLTEHSGQVPGPLPSAIRHCSFAPFQKLFPHCAAVVHHGGVGTMAKAFAAGKPQLILPMAFDQFDNASRVQQLGAGTWLGKRRRIEKEIAEALCCILQPSIVERCQVLQQRVGARDGLTRAAEWVQDFAKQQLTSDARARCA